MALTYSDVVSALYGDREFTSVEFGRATNSPRASRTLGELKRRGLIARVGRGRYRCLSPSERPDLRGAEYRRVRAITQNVPCRFAWFGPSAVEVWTDGRYSVSPSLSLNELHIAVQTKNEARVTAYLKSHGVSTSERRRVGTVVRVYPTPDLRVIFKSKEPVIPRSAVEEFIRSHAGLFGGASAWLDDRSHRT